MVLIMRFGLGIHHLNQQTIEINPQFSKIMDRKKENNTVCSSMNSPSNLVNNVFASVHYLQSVNQFCEPITLLDASFAHCSSTLFRGGRGEKHKIVQTAVFPIIFVTDCLQNLLNLKCGILLLFILNQIQVMYLPITSPLYKS